MAAEHRVAAVSVGAEVEGGTDVRSHGDVGEVDDVTAVFDDSLGDDRLAAVQLQLSEVGGADTGPAVDSEGAVERADRGGGVHAIGEVEEALVVFDDQVATEELDRRGVEDRAQVAQGDAGLAGDGVTGVGLGGGEGLVGTGEHLHVGDVAADRAAEGAAVKGLNGDLAAAGVRDLSAGAWEGIALQSIEDLIVAVQIETAVDIDHLIVQKRGGRTRLDGVLDAVVGTEDGVATVEGEGATDEAKDARADVQGTRPALAQTAVRDGDGIEVEISVVGDRELFVGAVDVEISAVDAGGAGTGLDEDATAEELEFSDVTDAVEIDRSAGGEGQTVGIGIGTEVGGAADQIVGDLVVGALGGQEVVAGVEFTGIQQSETFDRVIGRKTLHTARVNDHGGVDADGQRIGGTAGVEGGGGGEDIDVARPRRRPEIGTGEDDAVADASVVLTGIDGVEEERRAAGAAARGQFDLKHTTLPLIEGEESEVFDGVGAGGGAGTPDEVERAVATPELAEVGGIRGLDSTETIDHQRGAVVDGEIRAGVDEDGVERGVARAVDEDKAVVDGEDVADVVRGQGRDTAVEGHGARTDIANVGLGAEGIGETAAEREIAVSGTQRQRARGVA